MKRELKTKNEILIRPFNAEDLPPLVYKYREWANPLHKTLITDREVYMSPPADFFDQCDCRSLVKYFGLTQQELHSIYYHYSTLDHPIWKWQRHRKHAKKMVAKTPLKNKSYVIKYQEEDFKKFNEQAGVLSLSCNPISLKMWTEYANNHQGFIVAFNPIMLEILFTSIGKVTYYDTLPIIYPQPINSIDEQLIVRIFGKLKTYEFEDEFRIFDFDTQQPLSCRKRTIPANAFTKIIIGADMPSEVEADLRASIPTELKSIPIERAQKHLMT